MTHKRDIRPGVPDRVRSSIAQQILGPIPIARKPVNWAFMRSGMGVILNRDSTIGWARSKENLKGSIKTSFDSAVSIHNVEHTRSPKDNTKIVTVSGLESESFSYENLGLIKRAVKDFGDTIIDVRIGLAPETLNEGLIHFITNRRIIISAPFQIK